MCEYGDWDNRVLTNRGIIHGHWRLLQKGISACLLLVLLIMGGCGRHGVTGAVPDGDGPDSGAVTNAGTELSLDSPAPAGVDAALWRELTTALRGALAGRDKCASGVPAGEATRVADFVIVADTEGIAQASWSFILAGDYNYNGSVGVDDLAVVAMHWNVKVGDSKWPQARFADGNGDGCVDLGDITPLGQHFGEAVSGFEVQEADAAAESAAWTAVQQVGYSTHALRESDGVLQFRPAVPTAQAGRYYRVQPYYAPPVGAASFGLPGNAMRYYGGSAGAGAWPMGGHDARRSYRGEAAGPSAPGIAWIHDQDFSVLAQYLPELAISTDGSLYTGIGSNIYAYQPDGTLRWINDPETNDCNAPALGADGVLYFTSTSNMNGTLWAVNPDGSLRWTTRMDAWSSGVLLADGVIYLHTVYGLACYNLAGAELWRLQAHAATNEIGIPAAQTSSGLIVFARDDVLFAANPDGSLAWQQTLPGQVNGQVTAFSDGGIAVPMDSGVCAYSTAGKLQWVVTGFKCLSNLACAADDSLRVFCNPNTDEIGHEKLMSLRRDGTIIFETTIPQNLFNTSVIVDQDNSAYVCGMDDGFRFYCVDSSGGKVWERQIPYDLEPLDPMGCALGADGGLYVVGERGVFCLRDDGYGLPDAPAPSASSGAYFDHVRIQWPAVAHADSYRIYRDGATLPLAEVTDPFYDDYSVPDGGFHSFTVSGVNLLGEGEQSAPVQGRICIPPSRETAPGDWAMQGHDAQHTFRSNIVGPASAELNWSYTPSFTGAYKDVFYNSPVFGAEGTAYFSLRNGCLAALTPEGTELWRIKLGDYCSTPAIGADGTVYIVAEQGYDSEDQAVQEFARVYAINPNRTVKWFYESTLTDAGAWIGTGVTLDASGNVICMLATKELVKLSPAGDLLRIGSVPSGGMFSSAPLLGPEGNIYLFSMYLIASSGITAIDPAGVFLWDYHSAAAYDWGKGYVTGAPLVTPGGKLYAPGVEAVCFNTDGTVDVTDTSTGFSNLALAADGRIMLARYGENSLGWLDSADEYHQLTSVKGEMHSSLLLDGAGKVYYATYGDSGDNESMLYCFAADGSALWSHPVPGYNMFGGLALRDDGALFVASPNQLLVFDDP